MVNPSPEPLVVSDMDGTLTSAETWRGVLDWVRRNRPSGAAQWFVVLRLPIVIVARLGLIDKERFRSRWLRDMAGLLAGATASELAAMGEWVVEHHLWPARRLSAVEAVAAATVRARKEHPAALLVLATGGYQPVGTAFARRIGADVALGTPLEMSGDRATGRLAAATQSGEQKAAAVRALAAGGEIIAAFGDTAADVPLLSLAGRAIAVAPDAILRAAAQRSGWEVIEA